MHRDVIKTLVLGAAAFIAAHAIEAAARIGGDQPWFIAALPSALLTAGMMFAAGLFVGTRTKSVNFVYIYWLALSLVAGAAVPMVVTLFTHPTGPGNLFPIALIVGGAVLIAAGFGGTAIGWIIRRALR